MEQIVLSSPSVDAARDLKYCPSEIQQPQAAPRSTVKFPPHPKPRSGDLNNEYHFVFLFTWQKIRLTGINIFWKFHII
jgi:hypothetical protein